MGLFGWRGRRHRCTTQYYTPVEKEDTRTSSKKPKKEEEAERSKAKRKTAAERKPDERSAPKKRDKKAAPADVYVFNGKRVFFRTQPDGTRTAHELVKYDPQTGEPITRQVETLPADQINARWRGAKGENNEFCFDAQRRVYQWDKTAKLWRRLDNVDVLYEVGGQLYRVRNGRAQAAGTYCPDPKNAQGRSRSFSNSPATVITRSGEYLEYSPDTLQLGYRGPQTLIWRGAPPGYHQAFETQTGVIWGSADRWGRRQARWHTGSVSTVVPEDQVERIVIDPSVEEFSRLGYEMVDDPNADLTRLRMRTVNRSKQGSVCEMGGETQLCGSAGERVNGGPFAESFCPSEALAPAGFITETTANQFVNSAGCATAHINLDPDRRARKERSPKRKSPLKNSLRMKREPHLRRK